jgi:hypothetical protein
MIETEEMTTQVEETIATEVNEPLGDNGKKALQEERKARKLLEKQLKEVETRFSGIDPTEYQELVQLRESTKKQQEELELKALEEKNAYSEALAKAKTNYEQQIEHLRSQLQEKETLINQINSNYTTEKLKVTLFDALSKNDCLANEMIWKTYGDRLKIEDGEIKVLDQNGNLTINTLDEFITELKSSASYLFKSSIPNGNGLTPGSGQNKASVSGLSFDEFLKMSPSAAFNLANQNK